jgi:Dynein heavy chain, N-terminal region 1
MSQMRDLPPIAGAIIWARQIERQLLTYMKRVEDVLGKGWELYAEGQKLQAESGAFRKKLDTRLVFEAWMHDINRRDMGVNGRLFEIVRLRGGGFQLAVNFDPQIITLFKEVRNLLWLNFSVPHAITNMAKDAKRVYPHAVSLMETVRTYGQTLDLVENNKGIEWLVAEYRNEAQRMINKGEKCSPSLIWSGFTTLVLRYEHPVGLLRESVRHCTVCFECGWPRQSSRPVRARVCKRCFHSPGNLPGLELDEGVAEPFLSFQDKTNSVIDLYKDILRAIEDLSTCSYTTAAFTELLSKVQAAVSRL